MCHDPLKLVYFLSHVLIHYVNDSLSKYSQVSLKIIFHFGFHFLLAI